MDLFGSHQGSADLIQEKLNKSEQNIFIINTEKSNNLFSVINFKSGLFSLVALFFYLL